MTIFLDMDGVLANFHKGAMEALGHQWDEDDWPPGHYDIPARLGISKAKFWHAIEARERTSGFWNQLEEFDWVDQLLNLRSSGLGPPHILSSPSLSHLCISQKVEWLKTRGLYDPVLSHFTGAKHLLANANRVLIDDSPSNCQEWEMAGGYAILFPQKWNTNHMFVDQRIEFVIAKLTSKKFI